MTPTMGETRWYLAPGRGEICLALAQITGQRRGSNFDDNLTSSRIQKLQVFHPCYIHIWLALLLPTSIPC